MAKEEQLISVIIPIYKIEKYIKCCVESILVQTYKNLEILLVDDGSPDQCGKMCDEFARQDERVKVIHKENGGLSSARNAGLACAKGEYFFILDGDDFMEKNALQKLYEAAIETNSDLSVCNIQYVDERGQKITGQNSMREFCLKDGILSKDDFWRLYAKKGKIVCVITSNKLYKRKLFDHLRYPDGKIREDEFILHHIISRCNQICCVSEKLYDYRQREGSIMENKYSISHMDVVEAYLDRVQFCRKRKEEKICENALIEAVAFLEWYAFGAGKMSSEADARYRKLKAMVCKAGKEQLKRKPSLLFKGIMVLYLNGIFPYKMVKGMWWKVEKVKNKFSKDS